MKHYEAFKCGIRHGRNLGPLVETKAKSESEFIRLATPVRFASRLDPEHPLVSTGRPLPKTVQEAFQEGESQGLREYWRTLKK